LRDEGVADPGVYTAEAIEEVLGECGRHGDRTGEVSREGVTGLGLFELEREWSVIFESDL
jgi:hypothetical protein